MGRTTTVAVGVLFCAVVIHAQATTITVTSTNDSGPGSLRQALANANDGDTINFAVAGTISLTSGELLVDKNVTISGPGAATLAVDGNTTSRALHIGSGKTVSMSGLTLTNGSADFEGGGGILNDHAILTLDSCAVKNSYAQSNGGGINNDGSGGSAALTILNSTVNLNGVSYDGGGTYNNADNGGSATLAIMNSIVSSNGAGFADNFPTGSEGGVFNGVGSVTITNSSVSGNHVDVPGPNFPTGAGGGISNYGTLTITNSTIDSNYCFLVGGGVYNNGTLTIENSTVSGNRADGQHDGQPWGHGGGIVGEVTFINSTLSGNGASLSGGDLEGGGVIKNSTISGNGNGGISTGGMEIGNTILNNNLGVNIDGTATSLGYSDDGGGNLTRPGDQINTPPLIGNLQDNGGRTFTHALLPGSPAINAGDPNFTPHL